MPVFYRRIIVAAIERQLPNEPARTTRNRKCLEGLVAGFECEPPIWELRVDEWRIFYDIDEQEKTVTIRAIRRKPRDKTTEEIV